MTRLALADLRESWVAWLGVSLTFVVTNAVLATCLLFTHSADVAMAAGVMHGDDAEAVRTLPMINLATSALVALAVIGAATSLVVSARRSAIARLLLGGAGPGQVVRLLAVQLVVVSVVCASLGDLLAIVLTPEAIAQVTTDRAVTTFPMHVSVGALLAANAACIGLSLLGGLRQARAASRIPPVEALREATTAGASRMGRWTVAFRWVRFVVLAGAIVAAFPAYRANAHDFGKDALSMLMQVSVLLIPLTGLALAAVLPWLVGPVTSAWTRLVPGGPAWHLARHTVVAKADRLVRSVLPIMFATGLSFGILMAADTLLAALHRMGSTVELSGMSVTTIVTMIGMPMTVAIAGSVGNLVMMSQQRSAELALAGIVGAGPRQQLLVPAFEAVILTVTASVLGFVMAGVGAAMLASGLALTVPGATVSFPWGMLLGASAICLVVTLLATMVPVLRSLRQPAPRVVARLVAA